MSALPQPNQLPVEYLSELFDRDETRDPTYRTRGAQFTLGHETSQNQVAVNFGSGIIAFVAAISPQQPVRFPFHFNLTNVPHVVEIETVSTALEPILITERELASLEKRGRLPISALVTEQEELIAADIVTNYSNNIAPYLKARKKKIVL